jgi:hypothetical protein
MEDSQLTKRVKSFAWRLGMATAVFAAEWISVNAGTSGLPTIATGILALAAGEVSKYLNNKQS